MLSKQGEFAKGHSNTLYLVQVKKELVTEATETQYGGGCIESNYSSDSQSLDESDGTESMIEQYKDSESDSSCKQIDMDEMSVETEGDSTGVIKRKSDVTYQTQQMKRLHVTTDGGLSQDGDSDWEWAQIAQKTQWQHNLQNRVRSKGGDNQPKSHNKVVKFTPSVKIFTEHNREQTSDLNNRGLQLVENKEILHTPVRIEFNINKTRSEFNILEELTDLLDKLILKEPGLQLLAHTTNKVIWEAGQALPERDIFQDTFQMREQSYRTGNKKIVLFCVVEASSTINQLKYSEPVKPYIFEQNIWMKPDFYSTQVVSSPFFFTLVHPRLTNRIGIHKSS